MKLKDYCSLSVGDIVELTAHGLNKGKVCRVININKTIRSYVTTDKNGMVIERKKLEWNESVELELVDQYEVFLCKPYIGKKRMICKDYCHMTLIKKSEAE